MALKFRYVRPDPMETAEFDWRKRPVRDAAGGRPLVGFVNHPDCSSVKGHVNVLLVTAYPYHMFPTVWVLDTTTFAWSGSRPQNTPEFVSGFVPEDGRTQMDVKAPPPTFENVNLLTELLYVIQLDKGPFVPAVDKSHWSVPGAVRLYVEYHVIPPPGAVFAALLYELMTIWATFEADGGMGQYQFVTVWAFDNWGKVILSVMARIKSPWGGMRQMDFDPKFTFWPRKGMSYASSTKGVCRRYTPAKYVTWGSPVK